MKKLLTALLFSGCATQPERVEGTPDDACDGYPEDAVRPMELSSVLFPYSWAEARNLATGVTEALDLGQVPCATDENIDWSPFDVLLFVSIPAW